MMDIFDKVSMSCSRQTTHAYSTSFSTGIRVLDKNIREPIYAIYGFVRFADEIVDTFQAHNKRELLQRFRIDTWQAIEEKISLNPILHSFQRTYHQFDLDPELVNTFLDSMEMDLEKKVHDRTSYEKYILGSAEVVGLMCLKVFTAGSKDLYKELTPYAMRLGAAFQKVNFLRDIKADFSGLGRAYFPELCVDTFDQSQKTRIEEEIEKDFEEAYLGILRLPRQSRYGVYLAYSYYRKLFEKIRRIPSHRIMEERVRIPNQKKFYILVKSYIQHNLNLI